MRRHEDLAGIALLAVTYFVAGKLGLSLASVHPSSTAVWAPTGIALAGLLTLGYAVWPAIFLGAFLVNITTAGSIATSLGIATGNTLEGIVGAFLVDRYARGRRCFDGAQDTFKYALLAGLVSPTIAATIGVTSLSAGGFASWAKYEPIWLTWWLGDAAGALVVAPLLILWVSEVGWRGGWARFAELLGLLASLILVGQVVFGGSFPSGTKNYPLEYLCIPILMWSALRFGQREAATATVILSAMATWGTVRGFGPFAMGTANEALLLLQAFIGVVAVMTLGLSALSAERHRAEERAVHLALTDSLTGLGNYRKLVDVLELELKRSARTGRSCAVLLVDLDGLKAINDQYGYPTGSRALCRLAEVLRMSCRAIDTAVRLGGDEFAIVIPESGHDAAEQVAHRLRERLASDGERPVFSVSVGIAVYPQAGETIEGLLAAADRAFSERKRSVHAAG
jgi:diguanylate cyclase (GGDEF)-like protein